MSLLRTEAIAALARHRGSALALVTMRAVPIWITEGQADDRTFHVLGCMGAAASVGLGLALARPDERVLVIDGDGSLLMQLGTLATVAGAAPPRFCHVVLENGVYETSGGQDVPGRGVTDLCAVAAAAGYRHTARATTPAELDALLPHCLEQTGPVFVSLVVTGPGPDPVGAYDALSDKPTEVRAMRRALGAV